MTFAFLYEPLFLIDLRQLQLFSPHIFFFLDFHFFDGAGLKDRVPGARDLLIYSSSGLLGVVIVLALLTAYVRIKLLELLMNSAFISLFMLFDVCDSGHPYAKCFAKVRRCLAHDTGLLLMQALWQLLNGIILEIVIVSEG